MQGNIIDRLFASFTDLERAIESAKKTLANKPLVPQKVMERLKSYDGLLGKQKELAFSLCKHMNEGNWPEVSRHVGLINGLSAMIRDDAKSILGSLSAMAVAAAQGENIDDSMAESPEDDCNFC